MNNLLHDSKSAKIILQKIAETLLLIDKNGICLDVISNSDLWFLKRERLLHQNILDLLPYHTAKRLKKNFRRVLAEQTKINRTYRLPMDDAIYFFECTMQPYEGMVLCQYRDITQESNKNYLIERSNHTLKGIQKMAQIGQWLHNTKKEHIHYVGYTDTKYASQINNLPIDRYIELIATEDRPIFIEWYQKCQYEFNTTSVSYKITIDDETIYIKHQVYLREKQPDGSFNIKAYVQNITDVQQRRNDINTLTHAINNAKESIFAASKDGSIVFANRCFIGYHNLSHLDNLNGIKIYDVVNNVTQNQWENSCIKAAKEKGFDFILEHPVKDKRNYLAFEGSLYHVTNEANEDTFWAFAHDVSDRIRYESQIKRLNQIMNTIIENLPAGIIVKDANDDFKYIFRNKESYNREFIIDAYVEEGKNDFDYYLPEVAQQKRNEDINIVKTGESVHYIAEVKNREGDLLILDKRKILAQGDDIISTLIISIEWDITELELIKRELQSAKEKAELSDKLKSAFLANMSHEIRTPLNAIVGFSRLISETNDINERREYYDIVDANNERLLNLINEILDLSKIESGIVEFTLGSVSLDKLCKEVYDAHVFRTPQHVELIYEASAQSLIVQTDKNRIFQVLSNLIGNAFKFTVKGFIHFGYRLENKMILFYVRDTGIGIEAHKLGEVFDRFAKMNNFAQGTGLGLSICKTIIERLGGTISVTSEIGKGSEFTFTLPFDDSTIHLSEPYKDGSKIDFNSTPSKTSCKKAEQSVHHKQVILIAEDTQNNFDLLNAILGKQYKLLHAHDGIEAVTMFEEFKPNLILMDIKMPNLDGLEATKIIRELSIDVPIIAQSAYAYDYDKKTALDMGCNDFLPKPFSQSQLKDIVDKWLE